MISPLPSTIQRGSGQDSEISLADEHMVETLGSRRSTGRKRNLRSPSPMPSPRSPRSPSLPTSSLPSSHSFPSPSLSNHKHNAPKDRNSAEDESNGNKKPSATKETKLPKVEPGKDGVNHQNAESMETEQGRKVKPLAASSIKTLPNSSSADVQSSMNNSLHHRKRERTPSPTPSLPGQRSGVRGQRVQRVEWEWLYCPIYYIYSARKT